MLYTYAGIALASLALGFLGGWKTEAWRHDAAQLDAQRAATAKFKRDEKRVDVAAVGHEEFKAKEEIVYVDRVRIVTKLVDRPVYRNQCIDDDGVRLLNDAIAGRPTAGEPAPAVRGSRPNP